MPDQTITSLLEAVREGSEDAFEELYARVYGELKKLARKVRSGHSSETLNTTALVHEAYERLAPGADAQVENQRHFFRLAARAMRFILIDSARKRHAIKRGGSATQITFNEDQHVSAIDLQDLLSLNEALTRLETIDERKARVVECRYFAGLTIEDTAQALSISPPTVQRDWRAARAWLASEMTNAG